VLGLTLDFVLGAVAAVFFGCAVSFGCVVFVGSADAFELPPLVRVGVGVGVGEAFGVLDCFAVGELVAGCLFDRETGSCLFPLVARTHPMKRPSTTRVASPDSSFPRLLEPGVVRCLPITGSFWVST
jgi:hypothetical protein